MPMTPEEIQFWKLRGLENNPMSDEERMQYQQAMQQDQLMRRQKQFRGIKDTFINPNAVPYDQARKELLEKLRKENPEELPQQELKPQIYESIDEDEEGNIKPKGFGR